MAGWPTQVQVLTGVDIIPTPEGKPGGNLYSLMMHEFQTAPDDPDSELTVYMLSLRWDSRSNRIGFWYEEKIQTHNKIFKAIITQRIEYKIRNWNYFVKLQYNTIWASFGYTEGQDEVALDLLEYMNKDPRYKEICDNYLTLSTEKRQKYHAQKSYYEQKDKPKKQPTRKRIKPKRRTVW